MYRPINTGADLRSLLLMPSFYGGAAWTTALMLYWTRYVEWNPDGTTSILAFLGVALCFICSTIYFFPWYQRFAVGNNKEARASESSSCYKIGRSSMPGWLLLLHVIGLAGILIYARSMSHYLGGSDLFLWMIRNASHRIRAASSECTSIGTQIAYFGWIAAAVTAYRCFKNKLSKKWLWLVGLQIAANTLWIDRTRPLTIFFLCYAAFVLSRRRWRLSRAIFFNGAFLLGCFVIFVIIGTWIGKINLLQDSDSAPSITPAIKSTYSYLTSSFAYCNDVLSNDDPGVDVPYTLTPLAKLLVFCGASDHAPQLVLDFRDVPYSTNVSTFLPAFYWDGGWLYMAAGIIVYSFGMDLLGLYLVSSKNEFAVTGWAMCCWVSCMAFFTPKIASTETWLILAIAAYGAIMANMHRTSRLVVAGNARFGASALARKKRQPIN